MQANFFANDYHLTTTTTFLHRLSQLAVHCWRTKAQLRALPPLPPRHIFIANLINRQQQKVGTAKKERKTEKELPRFKVAEL